MSQLVLLGTDVSVLVERKEVSLASRCSRSTRYIPLGSCWAWEPPCPVIGPLVNLGRNEPIWLPCVHRLWETPDGSRSSVKWES